VRIVRIAIVVSGFLLTATFALSAVAVHRNGKLAYVTSTSSGTSIVAIDPSGGRQTISGPCSGPDCDITALAWSRDGSKLAFVRGYRGGGGVVTPSKMSLFVSDANGDHLRRLLACGACGAFYSGSDISWSPDGSTIVVDDGRRLELVNVETRSHKLVGPSCRAGEDVNPAWSPAGSEIAFGCAASLYLTTRTGAHTHVITTLPGEVGVGDLSWSPNGRTLAFDTPDSIYTLASDGSHLTRLLDGQVGGGPEVPSWSPDGKRIVYFYTPGGPSNYLAEVWVMNADGTQNHRLYESSRPVGDWTAPIWSPDGAQVAFSADAASGLMIMNANGSDLHRVAPAVGPFAWQPLP
jgi:Tol biopolymer transport system component